MNNGKFLHWKLYCTLVTLTVAQGQTPHVSPLIRVMYVICRRRRQLAPAVTSCVSAHLTDCCWLVAAPVRQRFTAPGSLPDCHFLKPCLCFLSFHCPSFPAVLSLKCVARVIYISLTLSTKWEQPIITQQVRREKPTPFMTHREFLQRELYKVFLPVSPFICPSTFSSRRLSLSLLVSISLPFQVVKRVIGRQWCSLASCCSIRLQPAWSWGKLETPCVSVTNKQTWCEAHWLSSWLLGSCWSYWEMVLWQDSSSWVILR